MTKLIIICGFPGTGKTTLANELSKKMGIFCLHKDSVKESLYESMSLSSLEESKKIGYPSVKIILDLAEENLARGIDVILESPFNFPDEGKLFSKWKKKFNLSLFSIVLRIDEEERKRRFLERKRHGGHHDEERRINAYSSFEASFNHMPENRIFLTVNKPVSKLVDEIIGKIKAYKNGRRK